MTVKNVRASSGPPRDGRAAWLPAGVAPPDTATQTPSAERAAETGSKTYRRPTLSEPYITEADDTLDTEIPRCTDFGDPPRLEVKRDRSLLVRTDGVDAGRVVSLAGAVLSIGRHPSNGLSLVDAGVSRFHARVEQTGHGYRVRDLGSRNGTYVQGRRVELAELGDGDRLELGPSVGFRFVFTDGQHEQLLRQLYESSNRDALTGAFNRKHFDERLRTEVAYAARHDADLSLILFDLDHFKRVNDTLGHPAGDAVLRQVARLAEQTLRAEDVLARFGGEEFAVILRGTSAAGALRLAERLRATIAAVPVVVERRPVPVTISAGCAALDLAAGASAEVLLKAADAGLYAAKRAGRDRCATAGGKPR